jgi:hypothetical protein
MTKDDLPKQWPKHFPTAICILNNRILPSIKFTPKEILFGMPVNTRAMPVVDVVRPFTVKDAAIHMADVEQQRLDGYTGRVEYALERKAAFNRKVLGSKAGEVVFEIGQLVQVFCSDLTHTMSNERKLTVKWSEPHRVQQQLLNSYILETVEGTPIDGPFSSRRLRTYVTHEGTPLAVAQAEFMAKVKGEAGEKAEAARKLREAEVAEVERLREEQVGAGLDG